MAAQRFAPEKALVVSDTRTSAAGTLGQLEKYASIGDVATAPSEDPFPDRYGDNAIHHDRVGFTGFIRAASQLDALMGTNLGWPPPESDPPGPEPLIAFA